METAGTFKPRPITSAISRSGTPSSATAWYLARKYLRSCDSNPFLAFRCLSVHDRNLASGRWWLDCSVIRGIFWRRNDPPITQITQILDKARRDNVGQRYFVNACHRGGADLVSFIKMRRDLAKRDTMDFCQPFVWTAGAREVRMFDEFAAERRLYRFLLGLWLESTGLGPFTRMHLEASAKRPRGKAFAKEPTSPFRLRIQACDLICRHDLDLWLPVAKSDCARDANGFPLDHGKPLIGGYTGSGRNVASERLIGVFSSEIDKCGPQGAGCYRDDPAAHLGFFADILNGFPVFYHSWFVRACHNHEEKQSEHCDEKTDQHCRMPCILASIRFCTITLIPSLITLGFFSVCYGGDKFVWFASGMLHSRRVKSRITIKAKLLRTLNVGVTKVVHYGKHHVVPVHEGRLREAFPP